MTPAAVLLRRTLPPLLLMSAAAGIATGVVSAQKDPGVEVALTFTVPAPTRQETRESRSPNSTDETTFEALQSAELFAQTLAGWLTSPDFVAAAYARAHVAFPGATVRRLSRAVTSVKHGGPVVEVRFRAHSSDDGRALARAIVEEIQGRTAAFNAATGGLIFRVTASDPLVIPVLVSPPLRGLVAALVAFVIGINLVLLVDFLRSPLGTPGREVRS